MIIESITWLICLCLLYQLFKVRKELRKDTEMNEERIKLYRKLREDVDLLKRHVGIK